MQSDRCHLVRRTWFHRTSIYKAIQGLQSHIDLQWIDGNFIFNLAEQVCADDLADRLPLKRRLWPVVLMVLADHLVDRRDGLVMFPMGTCEHCLLLWDAAWPAN